MVSRVPMGVRDTGQMAMHMARQATRRVYLTFPIFLETSGGRRVVRFRWNDFWLLAFFPWSCDFAVDLPFVVNHVIEKNRPFVQYYGPHYGTMGRCCDSWGEIYFYHMSFAAFFLMFGHVWNFCFYGSLTFLSTNCILRHLKDIHIHSQK